MAEARKVLSAVQHEPFRQESIDKGLREETFLGEGAMLDNAIGSVGSDECKIRSLTSERVISIVAERGVVRMPPVLSVATARRLRRFIMSEVLASLAAALNVVGNDGVASPLPCRHNCHLDPRHPEVVPALQEIFRS